MGKDWVCYLGSWGARDTELREYITDAGGTYHRVEEVLQILSKIHGDFQGNVLVDGDHMKNPRFYETIKKNANVKIIAFSKNNDLEGVVDYSWDKRILSADLKERITDLS